MSIDVKERVAQIIVEQLGVDEGESTRPVKFVKDVGAHSQDIVRLSDSRRSSRELPDEEAGKMATVGQAIEYIKAHEQ